MSSFVKGGVVIDGKFSESTSTQGKTQVQTFSNVQKSSKQDGETQQIKDFKGKILNDDHVKGVLYNEEDFDYFQYYGQLQEDDKKQNRILDQEMNKFNQQKSNIVITLEQKQKQNIVIETEKEKKKNKLNLIKIKKSTSQTENNTQLNNEEQQQQNVQQDINQNIQQQQQNNSNKEEDIKEFIVKKLKKTKSLLNYESDESDNENQKNQLKKQDSQEKNVQIKIIPNINKSQETNPKQQNKQLLLNYDSDSD